jgi:hypothetical protein
MATILINQTIFVFSDTCYTTYDNQIPFKECPLIIKDEQLRGECKPITYY